MIASIFFMRWVSSCRPQPVQRECHGARATGDPQVCVLSSGALIASGHSSDPCLLDDQPAHGTGTPDDCDGGVTIELGRTPCPAGAPELRATLGRRARVRAGAHALDGAYERVLQKVASPSNNGA